MESKKQEKSLMEIVNGEANGAYYTVVARAGVGGYTRSAPTDVLESLKKMGKEQEADTLAATCFDELVSKSEYSEAEKCIKYMTTETFDQVVYRIFCREINSHINKGGQCRNNLDFVASLHIKNRS